MINFGYLERTPVPKLANLCLRKKMEAGLVMPLVVLVLVAVGVVVGWTCILNCLTTSWGFNQPAGWSISLVWGVNKTNG